MPKAPKSNRSAMMSTGVGVVLRPGGLSGTAFFVNDTSMLTCAHVVRSAVGARAGKGSRVNVRLTHFTPAMDIVAEVECWDPTYDVAVLSLREPPARPAGASVLPMNGDVEVDEHDFKAFGYPDVSGGSQTKGEIQGYRAAGAFDLRNVDVAVPIRRGFSGAPIWDTDADVDAVVGMITHNQEAAQQHGRGIAVHRAVNVCPAARQPEVRRERPKSTKDRLLTIAHALRGAVMEAFEANVPQQSELFPDMVDEPEYSKYDGSAYFALWSTHHPLNERHPDDGDLFYVVAVESGEGAEQGSRVAISTSLEWSERGVGRAFGASRDFSLERLIGSLSGALKASQVDAFHAGEGEWSGVQLHNVESVDVTEVEDAGARAAQRLHAMGMVFDRWRQGAPLTPSPNTPVAGAASLRRRAQR